MGTVLQQFQQKETKIQRQSYTTMMPISLLPLQYSSKNENDNVNVYHVAL